LKTGLLITTSISALCVVLIFLFLFFSSLPILKEFQINDFIFGESWHPSENEFYILPMIVGSLYIMTLAMLISVPLGILTAIHNQFYSPKWFNSSFSRIVEILSGIPSVIYGFWGLVVIVPLLAQFQAPGTSLLAGAIVLTFIITPTIVLVANNAFKEVNPLYIQNAIALGLSRTNIIKNIILPQAKNNLITGIVLQSGRAIGETLAVLMVCGNVVQIPGNLFEPVRTLTSNIALEMAYAMDTHRSALFLSGMVLMVIVLLLIILTEHFSPLKTKS